MGDRDSLGSSLSLRGRPLAEAPSSASQRDLRHRTPVLMNRRAVLQHLNLSNVNIRNLAMGIVWLNHGCAVLLGAGRKGPSGLLDFPKEFPLGCLVFKHFTKYMIFFIQDPLKAGHGSTHQYSKRQRQANLWVQSQPGLSTQR